MQKQVVVIGGGVIGLSTAYALIQAGHQVTLLEARDEIAHQTSFANGGQLSYRYVSPLADAGVPQQALLWLGKAHSPLNFKLKFSPAQWAWLAQFLLACNRKDNVMNGEHILRLSLLSQRMMSTWRDQLDDFSWSQSGKMILHRDAYSFKKACQQLDASTQQHLTPAQIIALEPALDATCDTVTGAIFTPQDETADCYQFCLALFKKLQQSPHFKCLFAHAVTGFTVSQGKIIAVQSHEKYIYADDFVVAAGNGSAAIFNYVGMSVPIYPLKGYSLSLAFPQQEHVVPRMSVTDYAHKIVYAKLGQQLRIAAMVDLGYEHVRIRRERMTALKQIVQSTFPKLQGLEDAVEWSGLRPATPKGPPILGRTRYTNLWANIGHGSLGFTLAAGSAVVLSELIAQAPSPIALDGLSLAS